ncbi:MAG: hypothetical protein E7370_05660 [Clostridiales bacterium]|nr:hypothetical protein [Clostridiales bacterium]
MKIIFELLKEYGADTMRSFTVIPDFGGYFASVKEVVEYTPQKITLKIKRYLLKIVGENLSIGKYFEQDLLILGKILGVTLE